MIYNYSICHPNQQNIEYPTEVLNRQQVIQFAQNYPWKEQLELCNELPEEEVCYSPSLDFKNTESMSSFGLTADSHEGEEISFSLWYKRPKEIKIFFGLFGKIERMIINDVSSFSLDEAITYLEYFVNGNMKKIEELYK